ncbi:MAG TPA: hypothetical protein VMU01_12665 [Rhizomicrobium sp.]|nr:hypothetical protein [Rhizomicrobium sp.]
MSPKLFFHMTTSAIHTTFGSHPSIPVRMVRQLFCLAVAAACVCLLASAGAETLAAQTHLSGHPGVQPQHETMLKLSPRTLQHAFAGRSRVNFSPIQRQGATALLSTGATPMFACNAIFCSCRGDSDCNDMFTTDLCGPSAECNEDSNICICLRR